MSDSDGGYRNDTELQQQQQGGGPRRPHDDIEGKIFVGGLSWQTTEASLRIYFERFGELSDAAIMIDKRTGQPRYSTRVLSIYSTLCLTHMCA